MSTVTEAAAAASLRDKQKQLARDAILEALAGEVATHGLDFSLPDVAEAAGVSHRTIYNYFENREALLLALPEWVDQRLPGEDLLPDELADLPEGLRVTFAAFAAHDRYSEAMARFDHAGIQAPSSLDRTAALRALVVKARPDLDDKIADGVTGVLRQLASFRNWYDLTRVRGVDEDHAADITAWAVTRIIEGLLTGENPTDIPPARSGPSPRSTPGRP